MRQCGRTTVAWGRAVGHHFGAADEDRRVDAERPAQQAEHDDGADAELAAPDSETGSTAEAAAFATAVLDVLGSPQIVPPHSVHRS